MSPVAAVPIINSNVIMKNKSSPGSGVKHLPPSFYTNFLSKAAKARKPNPIRQLVHLESVPGMISLLAGKPNASMFPFTSFNITAHSPMNPGEDISLKLNGPTLDEGLQYGHGCGQKLCAWMTGLQEFIHGRKMGEGWQLISGAGSQDLISKAAIAMLDPGDPILVESPVYCGAIPNFQDLYLDQIEVETDADGISSSSLRSILENWPVDKPKPKVLYTVPYGCNPTGMTATLERRKEVLRLAREHNFMILEDDPYYYLYYGKAARPPSYFTLELEEPEVGRVIRFDSLSKVLSAGIRLGFASGPGPIIEAINRHISTSSLQVPSFTQMIALALLNSWGYEAYKLHTENVSIFYRDKRDIFEKALIKHLTGLAEWTSPEAGMFFWFKLLLNDCSEEGDSESIIRSRAVEHGVLALPGTVFLPNGRKSAYVRASFSLTPEEDVERAVMRLRDVILEARAAESVP